MSAPHKPAPYIGGRPAQETTVVALSSKLDAVVHTGDDRLTLVRESRDMRDAIIGLTAEAEANLLALLLRRRGLEITFLRP